MTDDRAAAAVALGDLRVIDASTPFAGPMTAMHRGDLGAEVVTMEHAGRPDRARRHRPEPWLAAGRSRTEHGDEPDEGVGGWIPGHTRDEVKASGDRGMSPGRRPADARTRSVR